MEKLSLICFLCKHQIFSRIKVEKLYSMSENNNCKKNKSLSLTNLFFNIHVEFISLDVLFLKFLLIKTILSEFFEQGHQPADR